MTTIVAKLGRDDAAERLVLATAFKLLGELVAQGANPTGIAPARAECPAAGLTITISFAAWERIQGDATAPPRPPRRLGPTERRIVELCRSSVGIAGRTLARRVGKPYSSYFRGLLTRLVREGRLTRHDGGYVPGEARP